MSKNSSRLSAIERAAYEWLAVNTGGEPTRAEREAFDAWMAEDSVHAEVYNEIASFWQDETVTEALRSIASAARGARADNTLRAARPRAWLWRSAGLAAGFAALAVLGATVSLSIASRMAPTQPVSPYATAQAEISDIVLPDGSTVTLGAQSQVSIDFSEEERRVALLAGEAYFAVATDAERPFIVTVDGTEVRVVGTKFDVRRGYDGVRIGVAEGVVEVSQIFDGETGERGNGQTPRLRARLAAGQQIVAPRGRALEAAAEIDASIPGAWRDRRLIYQNTALEQVIADVDRYYVGDITIASDEIKDLAITATFRSDDVSDMINLLSQTLPVRAERRANGEIVLHQASRN